MIVFLCSSSKYKCFLFRGIFYNCYRNSGLDPGIFLHRGRSIQNFSFPDYCLKCLPKSCFTTIIPCMQSLYEKRGGSTLIVQSQLL